jgi:hypothetical protein
MNTQSSSVAPGPVTLGNLRGEAQEIDKLMLELKGLEARAKVVRQQIREKFTILESVAPEAVQQKTKVRTAKKATTRPDADKLIISSGRAIVRGLKLGLKEKENREQAIAAATKVAKQYGITELSPEVIARIDAQIKAKYSAATK